MQTTAAAPPPPSTTSPTLSAKQWNPVKVGPSGAASSKNRRAGNACRWEQERPEQFRCPLRVNKQRSCVHLKIFQ